MSSLVQDVKAAVAALDEVAKTMSPAAVAAREESRAVLAKIAAEPRPAEGDRKGLEAYRQRKRELLFSYINAHNATGKATNKAIREANKRAAAGSRRPMMPLRFYQAARVGSENSGAKLTGTDQPRVQSGYVEVLSVQGFKEEVSKIRRGLRAYASLARQVHSHGGKVRMLGPDGHVEVGRSQLREAERLLGHQISLLTSSYSAAKKRRPVWYDRLGQLPLREARAAGGFETPILINANMCKFVTEAFNAGLLRPLTKEQLGLFMEKDGSARTVGGTTTGTLASSIFVLYTMNDPASRNAKGGYTATPLMERYLGSELAKLEGEHGGFNNKGDLKVDFKRNNFKYAAFQQIVKASRLPSAPNDIAKAQILADAASIKATRRAYVEQQKLSPAYQAAAKAKKAARSSRSSRKTGGGARSPRAKSSGAKSGGAAAVASLAGGLL